MKGYKLSIENMHFIFNIKTGSYLTFITIGRFADNSNPGGNWASDESKNEDSYTHTKKIWLVTYKFGFLILL